MSSTINQAIQNMKRKKNLKKLSLKIIKITGHLVIILI